MYKNMYVYNEMSNWSNYILGQPSAKYFKTITLFRLELTLKCAKKLCSSKLDRGNFVPSDKA